MSETKPGFNPEIKLTLTRDAIKNILASTKEHKILERSDLKDLDLTGLDLSKRSFRNCDVRGLSLNSEINKENTNIENSEWTDAVVEAYGPYTNFQGVKAKGSKFGFTETLYKKQKKLKEAQESGKKIEAVDKGLYIGFDGRSGNFQECVWNNIDFQGSNDYGAMFHDADLSGSKFDGCDLRGLDWSTTKIDNIEITIYDPQSLEGLKINTEQIKALISAIQFNDEAYSDGFKEECAKQTPESLLWNFLGVDTI